MKLNKTIQYAVILSGTALFIAASAAEEPASIYEKAPKGNTTISVKSQQPQGGIKGEVTSTETAPVKASEQQRNDAFEKADGAIPFPHAREVTSSVPAFTKEQVSRIEEISRNYLLAHPEVLVEVSEKLQAQQEKEQMNTMTSSVLQHQDALLKDPGTPSYGPEDAKVALVEFFDYQCVVCARQARIIESLMKVNPQVRYVFKEWPIFAQRWSSSLTAAETGLKVWQKNGADSYLAYHNALYATDHNEGKLTGEDIKKAAAGTGNLEGNSEDMLRLLTETDALARNLGLQGTPGIIVMPVSGARADNVTIIPGGADQDALQVAIDKAASLPDK